MGGGSYVFKLTMLYGIPVAVLKAGISLSANSLAVTIIRRCLEGERGGYRREEGGRYLYKVEHVLELSRRHPITLQCTE